MNRDLEKMDNIGDKLTVVQRRIDEAAYDTRGGGEGDKGTKRRDGESMRGRTMVKSWLTMLASFAVFFDCRRG